MNIHERTRLLIGDQGIQRLRESSVAVYGLGGVGGYAFEALVRAGVGKLYVVDCDIVEPSNLNRQILATQETIGRKKVDVAMERAKAICPDIIIVPVYERILPENVHQLVPNDITYAIEAIDSLGAKVSLIAENYRRGNIFVSCMGAARRLNPEMVRAADISETFGCPLAKRVRTALRKQGIVRGVRCVFSAEPPVVQYQQPNETTGDNALVKRPQGSLSYIPGMLGLFAAGLILSEILKGALH
ncbi:MAG TPA: tRNA threonylcarbamoyladenosine dehydratase [Candidatus Hydrogenedentes bacterium]|nr:tRNA threonylcarbamoyladenosine dehydratase [Candidatus Hydrogenedentota bacterium]HOL77350.1 tRNA threonylcarbamoyladenosine dehydratase [Candidatus Hydrogenedentota bacterium]HPO84832.1 tRNA threonylcarbamoyladenosine dehydratase [Candidatus Hydrogenedentota bacterium]